MLDKSVPFFGVLMTKNDMKTYPRFMLPAGYSFSGYRPGDETVWADLMFCLEQTESLTEARQIFQTEFLARLDCLERQCLFVLDDQGRVAATASLWYGSHFGREQPRIHWVAADPAYQGRGLVKALLTRLLDVYHALGFKDGLYLTTQTWSYKAINLYRQFGFEPYLGERPLNWDGSDFEADNQTAWAIIESKIADYKIR